MFTKIFDYLTSLFRGNGAESVPNVTEKSFPVAGKPTESNQKGALTIDKRGLKCSGFDWDYPKTVWLTVLSIPMTEETNIPMTEMGNPEEVLDDCGSGIERFTRMINFTLGVLVFFLQLLSEIPTDEAHSHRPGANPLAEEG
ncbi:hypothetical protein OUZ56_009028 [Daphnia magna]|uniref:Uncharacterized protein n=1 Tax=Daphnia magna TaxID=35525 RepID=A0ABR0AEU3_9CRUS|nr:hypothetical protein OUZ56_009028 [Daphnia magna]